MQLRYPGISLMQVLCILIPTVRSLSNWLGETLVISTRYVGSRQKSSFWKKKKDPANIGLCWSVYKDFIMYTQTVSVQDKLLPNGPKNFPYWPLKNRVLSVFMLLDKYLGKTHREQENLLQRSQYCCNCAMLYIDSSVASVQYPNPFTKQASSMMGKSNYWLSKMKAQLP